MTEKNKEDNIYLRDMICPVCGNEFILPPMNVYKLLIKGVTYHYCSYSCFRKIQKKKEREG